MLERIAASKAREVAELVRWRPELERAAAAAAPARPFVGALKAGERVRVVAEYKRRSPSAGELGGGRDPADAAIAYAAGGAAALSVLTDGPYFGGSLEDLRSARSAVGLPVLRKDFVVDAVQLVEARAAGADAALLIVRLLEAEQLRDLVSTAGGLGLDVLVEVHDRRELDVALSCGAAAIGINNRDLDTFLTDLAVSLELAAAVPADRVLVAESGIRGRADVDRLGEAGVDAVLVGESLMRSADARAGVAALSGSRRAPRGPVGRVRVKICGLCRPEDAAAAAAAGADYVGVVLAPGYGRSRSVERAAEIYAAAPGALRAGVFVDGEPGSVIEAAQRLRLDVVQLHGGEEPGVAARIGAAGPWTVWKAVRPRDGDEYTRESGRYSGVVGGLLLDGWSESAGGVGARFPWADVAGRVHRGRGAPALVAAGGLRPDNVAGLIALLAPDVVDVSSGVEEAPCRKSAERMRAFVEAARVAAGAGS